MLVPPPNGMTTASASTAACRTAATASSSRGRTTTSGSAAEVAVASADQVAQALAAGVDDAVEGVGGHLRAAHGPLQCAVAAPPGSEGSSTPSCSKSAGRERGTPGVDRDVALEERAEGRLVLVRERHALFPPAPPLHPAHVVVTIRPHMDIDPSHPVLDVLREREESGSVPGERHDPHRVALVIEGGGMRGVVSAGMSAALERLGLTRCFDLVVGSSAGAINGAALLAGVARHGAATYSGPLASRTFVNPARVLRGRPVIDVHYALNYTSADLDAARHERVLENPIAMHCVAVERGDRANRRLLRDALEARALAGAAGIESHALGRRPAGGDRRPALHRRRNRLGDPRRGGPRGRSHPCARPADPPARRTAQERIADRRPPDRAAPAQAQPGARDPLPRAGGRL